jgi:hypothetical protein
MPEWARYRSKGTMNAAEVVNEHLLLSVVTTCGGGTGPDGPKRMCRGEGRFLARSRGPVLVDGESGYVFAQLEWRPR